VSGSPAPAYPPGIKDLMTQQTQAQAAGDLDQVEAIQTRLWLDGPLAPEGRVTGEARRLFRNMNAIALRSPPIGRDLDATLAFPGWVRYRCPHLWSREPSTSRTSRNDAATSPGRC